MKHTARYLYAHELRPTVDLAGCHRLPRSTWTYANPTFHFMLVESGRIDARPPTGQFIAAAGDLICFRPAPVNQYVCPIPTTFYQVDVLFAPPPHQQLIPWLEGVGPLPEHVILGNAFDEVRTHFETICMELPRRGGEHSLRIAAAVLQILAVATIVARDGKAHPPVALDLWQRALLRLDTQLEKPLRLDVLAREIGVGTDHFIRMFHARFGVTPKAYHTQARLREAVRLLRTTQKPIKEIAFALGFSSLHAFARLFKRYLGVAPSQLGPHTMVDADPAAPNKLFPINTYLFPPHRTSADYTDRGLG